MKKIATTNRTYLRELTEADAELNFLLNQDTDVIKYTGDVRFDSIVEAGIFLKNYDHYKKYGFGRWAVIRKEDDAFLGWCGLKYDIDSDEFDIGFRFLKKYWNQGYATESAKACLQIGFEQFNMSTIVGRVVKENIASVKVLEKLGFIFIREFTSAMHPGAVLLSYEITNTQ